MLALVVLATRMMCGHLIGTAPAADEVLRQLPTAVTAAALNATTGDVAIASAQTDQVWVLPAGWFADPRVAPAGPLASVRQPVSLLYKQFQDRSYLVVACFDSGGIVVLDAETRQTVASFPPNPASPKILVSAANNPQDPWIYVTGASGNQLRLDAFRLDASPPTLQSVTTPNRDGLAFQLRSGGFVASSSGQWLYGLDQDRRTITRWELQLPPSSRGAPQAKYRATVVAIESEQPWVRLPQEQGFAQGAVFRLPDLRRSSQPLPFRVAGNVGTKPLVAGLSDGNLQVASLASGKIVARVPLPAGFPTTGPRATRLQANGQGFEHIAHPIVLTDFGRDRIIVMAGRHATSVPITPLGLPDEPTLTLTMDVPPSVTVGDAVAIDVGKVDSRVDVSLLNPPKGMQLRAGQLVWRPEFSQIGRARFALELRYAATTVRHDYEITVTSQTLTCPFPATHGLLDDTGSRLVIWRLHAPNQLGVMDLDQRQAVMVRELPLPIIAAALSGEFLCALTGFHREAALVLLDPRTLREKSRVPIQIQSTTRYLDGAALSIKGKTVTIHTSSGIRHSFPLPDLNARSDQSMFAAAEDSPQLLVDLSTFIRHAPHQAVAARAASPVSRQAFVTFTRRHLQTPSSSLQRHAPVVSDDFPVRLGLHLDTETMPGFTRIDLAARPMRSEAIIQQWAVEQFETARRTRDMPIFFSTSLSKAVIVIEGRVYQKDLASLSATKLATPFRLLPQQSTPLAKLSGMTRLSYQVAGGRAPIALAVSLPGADGSALAATRVPGVDGQFDVDVGAYLTNQLPKIAAAMIDWSDKTDLPETIMTRYAATVSTRFEELTGQVAGGIPVAIPVVVMARDANGQTEQLDHYLLADVPRELLALPVNVAAAIRWRGTTVGAKAAARAKELSRPNLVDGLITLSQELRKANPRKQLTDEQLEAAARDALDRFETRWKQARDSARSASPRWPLRRWVDRDGKAVTARFVQAFAGQVIVSNERGLSLTFPADRLSDDDQAYVRTVTAAAAAAETDAATSISLKTRLSHLALAMHKFQSKHQSFPPPASVDDTGKPTLSWRVLILPHLGATELYQLFRLDEPWDSTHNLRLAQYLPAIFRVDEIGNTDDAERLVEDDTASLRTPFVRLIGADTAAAADRLIRIQDITDGTSNTLLAVVANAQHRVVWTKPDDLTLDANADFSQHLHWQDGTANVVMCDASTRRVRETNSPEAWQAAALRNDRSSLQLVE